MRFLVPAFATFVLVNAALANDDGKKISIAEAADTAISQSQLTLPGSSPFHLKAKIVESTNPESDYKADIEEYWLSPQKWRRTIQSPNFSQTLIVNGEKISEHNIGDYYPFWLSDLVTALFDPLPMLPELKQSKLEIAKPNGSEHSNSCARFQIKVGTPPVQNSAFLVFCFEGSHGLLESANTPSYHAIFEDYEGFKNKRVARRIVTYPEPGTRIEATVTDLKSLSNADESLFAIGQPSPIKEQLKTVVVTEAIARSLSVNTPEIKWSPVRDGKTSGVLSLFVFVDKTGHVRETWPLNSDNAQLDDSAREQVQGWQFKPAGVIGAPVQIETVLTFAFDTKIENPVAILSDAETRKLATHIVEADFPAEVRRRVQS